MTALALEKGRYRARMAHGVDDLTALQALRYRCFVDAGGGGLDGDEFDARCDHVLIEPRANGAPVAGFRLLFLADGGGIGSSYSARFYDLTALAEYPGPMVELGRFCIAPEGRDGDILRLAWAVIAAYVERRGAEMLFGCSSFWGNRPEPYADAFAMLRDRHLAPRRFLPLVKAPNVFRYAARLKRKPDPRKALVALPPLLRSYLSMGGWVSDHAVVDEDLNTLHVFTGLEVAQVPKTRARALRALAG